MLKSIFVPMNGNETDELVLGTALAMAQIFESHLECVRVRMSTDYLVWESNLLDAVSGLIEGDLISQLEQQDRERTTSALRIFKKFCEREKIAISDTPPGPVGVSARWQEMRGHQVSTFQQEARFHDLVVVARSLLADTDPGADFAGNILLGCGRPILLAPAEPPKTLGKTIAIAWKNSPEVARAVSAAMPILAQAEKVIVMCAPEDDMPEEALEESGRKLASTLRWNGCNAETFLVYDDGAPARNVLDQARRLDVDLLVMGGYGHSRLRETVFGGFTKDILIHSPLPVFMFH